MKNFITMIMMITLCVTNAQTWTNYTTTDGLIEGIVSSLIKDNDGKIWFSDWSNNTSAGIGSFDGIDWTSLAVGDGAPSNSITKTFQDSDGNFWFGTFFNNGVSRYDGVNWINYTTLDGLVNDLIWDIFQDSSSDLWFLGGGISIYDGTDFTNIETINGQVFNATGMVEDANGVFWFATSIGLVKYDGVDFTVFGTSDGFSTDAPSAIFLDSNNNIWVAGFVSATGIDKFDGVTVTTYSFGEGIVNIDVRYSGCFAEDSVGNIYIGTNFGVSVFDGANWSNIGPDQGLPNTSIRAVLMNDDDTFWLSHFDGLSLYNPLLGTNNTEVNEINISPNPAKNSINISSSNLPITNIEMYDMLGNLIINKKGNNITNLNISNQPNGIYIVIVRDSENNSDIKKIIKN